MQSLVVSIFVIKINLMFTIFFLGGISAAVTTPLDVVKTRIMLADKTLAASGTLTVRNMMKVVYKEKGMTG